MVIDGHCHVGAGDGFTGPWDTRASLRHYLPRARAAGISCTVLLPAFNSDYAGANRMVAELARRHPRRFLPLLFVHPQLDRGRVARIVAAAARGPFVGIKVHRHDAPLSRDICEAAARFRMPVLYDVMGEVHPVALFAREYPQVPFIIPHLGSFGDDWRAHETLIDLLARFPNVFTDTSGVRRFDYLVEAVRRAGAQKVIFGSDGPFLHPGLELAKIRLLHLSAHDEALVSGGNILRLIQRIARPCVHSRRSRCQRCSTRVGRI